MIENSLMAEQVAEGGQDSVLSDAMASLEESQTLLSDAQMLSVKAHAIVGLATLLALVGAACLGAAVAIQWL